MRHLRAAPMEMIWDTGYGIRPKTLNPKVPMHTLRGGQLAAQRLHGALQARQLARRQAGVQAHARRPQVARTHQLAPQRCQNLQVLSAWLGRF